MPPLIMTFSAGSRLGHYQILSHAGTGGMGEVYKATDTRLNRSVAIKVLPAHIADKPESRQRFEREAQAIAALNHPHICVIHDVGEHEGTAFMVMEYIEGETLADRVARGPIPFDQLLAYGIQIADALDKAHRRGVVHRDLKPGNIMVTRTGVKLLDFGLAKLQDPVVPESQSAVHTVAALTQPLTEGGMILGTLQYMSPEQLEGKVADARSDIFAFGAVLYEMATGRRAFEGKSQVSLIAAILEREPPPVSSLQPVAPALFDDVIRICLAKNPDDRWQSAADLLHQLKLLLRYEPPTAIGSKGSRKREIVAWTAAAVLLIALGSSVLPRFFSSPPEPDRVVFEVPTPVASAGFELMMVALSPDGSHLAYLASDNGTRKIWVRNMDQAAGVPLAGTDNSLFPFWSPDGKSIGFFTGSQLKRVDIAGGPPLPLTSADSGRGGTWNRDNVIVYAAETNGPLSRISASGGEPTRVTELNKSRQEFAHKHPWFLPDGVHFLFLALSQKPENSGIYLGSLNSKETTRLVPAVTNARFTPPDRLLFLRENSLMMQRLNPNDLKMEGDAVRVVEGVGVVLGTGNVSGFGVSANGRLAYRPGGSPNYRSLAWISNEGKPLGSIGSPGDWENPKISQDGKRLAVFKREASGGDIWIFDLEAGGNPSRFTFDAAEDNDPLWDPAVNRIIFASNRDGGVFNLYEKSSSQTGEDKLLLKTKGNKRPADISADGRYLLYEETDPTNNSDIWMLNLSGDPKPKRLVDSKFIEQFPSFSPDMHWIAYSSSESGATSQVFVQDFPALSGKYQVSPDGGGRPRWRDNKEFFFTGPSGQLWSVDLSGTSPGGLFKRGTPHQIFSGLIGGPTIRNNFDIPKGDNSRLLVLPSVNQVEGTPPIVVMMNWTTGLK